MHGTMVVLPVAMQACVIIKATGLTSCYMDFYQGSLRYSLASDCILKVEVGKRKQPFTE